MSVSITLHMQNERAMQQKQDAEFSKNLSTISSLKEATPTNKFSLFTLSVNCLISAWAAFSSPRLAPPPADVEPACTLLAIAPLAGLTTVDFVCNLDETGLEPTDRTF